jgi:outer membrane protein insertion porin family
VKDETFAEDRQRLEALYHNNGYRDARVEDVTTKAGLGPRDLTLVVTVFEGPKYRMGVTRWVGATVIDTTQLKRISVLDPGDTYNASRIQRARDEAFGMYAEHGYLYVNIEAHEDAHDKTVDVTYAVTEGAPSYVRRVNIEGNRNTRERVIRREIDIHEGDLFKRSSLISTRETVMRLGIFEDVMPDLSPAESTDVDVVIKVKEKQVGTASAGAGYTGESGVTGFLELSHNNVLGNGQSLALHLERGGRVENYSLSFTEPWFRGTRTLFGVSGVQHAHRS